MAFFHVTFTLVAETVLTRTFFTFAGFFGSGVTAFEGVDGAETPTALVAVTVKV